MGFVLVKTLRFGILQYELLIFFIMISEKEIWDALDDVKDPEIKMIYDLGC
ncbi:MAG: hypothetical protein M3R36_06115 [Bacteroidota bacterium]|nr:hypothetical protein [Bacteroidota bacterium]